MAGCEWHSKQLLPLNAGPSPARGSPLRLPVTETVSPNRKSPSTQNVTWSAGSPGIGCPAPVFGCGPGRGPGSTADGVVCANAVVELNQSSNAAANRQDDNTRREFSTAPRRIGTFITVVLSFFLQHSGRCRSVLQVEG